MIIIEKQGTCLHLYSDADLYLTRFNEKIEKYRYYIGDKNFYLTADDNPALYYEITLEQHLEYERRKEEELHPITGSTTE